VKRPTRLTGNTSLTCVNTPSRDLERGRTRSPLGTNTVNCLERDGLRDIRNRAQPWPEWSSGDMPCGAPAAGGGGRADPAGTTLHQ
jgi:hypothetical protein